MITQISNTILILIASLLSISRAQPVYDISSRRQVFIDGRYLQNVKDIELKVHPPQKTNDLCIVCEHPWEQQLGFYHSVLKDGGIYHMWYTVCEQTDDVNVLLRRIAYARSTDGIHWEKPELGLVEVHGTRKNNIVLGPGFEGIKGATHGCMVFLDPQAPLEERFRLVSNPAELGKKLQIFSSSDGIHWKRTHQNVMGFRSEKHHLDSQNVIFWDTRIKKYVAYVRRNLRPTASQGRSVARAVSDNLSHFPDVEDCPVILGFDEKDPTKYDPVIKQAIQIVDFYTNATFLYPWADDAYFMFPSEYFHYMSFLADYRKRRPVNAGSLDIRFAASRDGIHWQRYDRGAFVDLGLNEDWDSLSLYMVYGIVPAHQEQELYIYYTGSNILHGWNRPDSRNRESNNRLLRRAGLAPAKEQYGISRLVIRRDGFISARAAYTGGEFTTPLLRFQGNELVLNIDTSASGLVRVEIQDERDKPMPGFGMRDCDPIYTTNQINRQVTWNGQSDVEPLVHKTIRLRFVMRDADLYAFQFRNSESK